MKSSGNLFLAVIPCGSAAFIDHLYYGRFSRRCQQGISISQHLPSQSRLKGSTGLTPEVAASYKYIERGGKIEGYFSGFTFSNMLGLTMQVPYTMEIVSNSGMVGNFRVVSLAGRKIALRRPRAEVTGKNRRVLQFLDFLKDYEEYVDDDPEKVSVRLAKLVESSRITKEDVDCYISLFPEKVYKNFYDLRLYDVLA